MALTLRTVTVAGAMLLTLAVGTAYTQESSGPGMCAADLGREQTRVTGPILRLTDPGPLWSTTGKQVQFSGKVLCTECTLQEAAKAYPHISSNRLYEVRYGQGRMVTELQWTNNPRWRDALPNPHVLQLRADSDLLQKILTKENRSKELQASGLLSQLGILHLHDVQVCN